MFGLMLNSDAESTRRVTVIAMPRADKSLGRSKEFLPPSYIRCTTNKDEEDGRNIGRWVALGEAYRILDLGGIMIPSSTTLRRALRRGEDWRTYIPKSCHAYFQDIDGPHRLLSTPES